MDAAALDDLYRQAMEWKRKKREADDAAWLPLMRQAMDAGQCVACLGRSRWRTRPRFVRHRDRDNCPSIRQWL